MLSRRPFLNVSSTGVCHVSFVDKKTQLRPEIKLPETTLTFSGSRAIKKTGTSGKLVVGGA